MSKSIEEQVYKEFSDAVNSGDLEGAFKNATEDMTFRPIGTHPELGREFKGMQDILENCWMKVFQHIDENGVAITVNDIVTADGIAFRTVQRHRRPAVQVCLTTTSTYTCSASETAKSAVLPSSWTRIFFTNCWNNKPPLRAQTNGQANNTKGLSQRRFHQPGRRGHDRPTDCAGGGRKVSIGALRRLLPACVDGYSRQS